MAHDWDGLENTRIATLLLEKEAHPRSALRGAIIAIPAGLAIWFALVWMAWFAWGK